MYIFAEHTRLFLAYRTAVLASGGRLGRAIEVLQLHEDHLHPQLRHGRSRASRTFPDNVAESGARRGDQSARTLYTTVSISIF